MRASAIDVEITNLGYNATRNHIRLGSFFCKCKIPQSCYYNDALLLDNVECIRFKLQH